MTLIGILLTSLITLVQLNCENFFDCYDDSTKNDNEFTPESLRGWSHKKFRQKADHLSQEIISCGKDGDDWHLPDLVALCEVESRYAMDYLTRQTPLFSLGYDYVKTESPDLRGINVALMYRQGSIKLLKSYPLRVKPLEGMRPTRDILYVSCRTDTGDTLHVFVTHAPSKLGGDKMTRPYRLKVMERICASADSIRQLSPRANIIVTGDFNDDSQSATIQQLISNGFQSISSDAKGMFGNDVHGTYKYKGEWENIDHIMVSGDIASWQISCQINDSHFLLEKDKEYGGNKPLRTFYGMKFQNGYSDHMPLVGRFVKRRQNKSRE